jgi:hypothetical protein
MASIAVDDGIGNSSQELVNHDRFVVLRDRVESLLNDVASKGVHREIEGVAPNSLRDFDHLFRRTVLEASLN